MNFLAPLFLLGTLAVTLPVIFHLMRRRSREKIPFSSLMFLSPTPPRVTRRSHLEHILLLILRCLVLCLLALGFARPFFQQAASKIQTGHPGKRLLVLVDTSASMRRSGVWSIALSKTQAALKSAAPQDQVALYVFDRNLRGLVSFEEWTGMAPGDRAVMAMKRLSDNSPGWFATHLGKALIEAAEILEAGLQRNNPEGSLETRQILLVSDLQEGSRLEGLQGYEWPRGLEVTIESIQPKKSSNAGLQWLAEESDSNLTGPESEPKLRVSNASDSQREQFQIHWLRDLAPSSAKLETVDAYVPAGQSRIVSAPRSINGWTEGRLQLTGDDETFDNTIYLLPPTAEKLKLIYLGSDTEQDATQPLYFLRRAFPETRRQTIEIVARQPGSNLLSNELAEATLMVIADPVSGAQTQVIQQFLAAGKTALVLMKSPAAGITVGGILGINNLEVREAPSTRYAMLGQIDFQHPLFAPFADPRYSDFTKIHFWRHRQLPPETLVSARVICRFDNGDPALIQTNIGPGSLMVFTAGWHPADSQLALSSKFVPLLQALLELSRTFKPPLRQYWTGDEINLAFAGTAGLLRITKPDGTGVELAAGNRKFTQTDLPGLYTVAVMPAPVRFVVNLAPEESRTGPLPLVDFERLGVPLRNARAEDGKQIEIVRQRRQAAELENQQKLWQWLILTSLVVLIMETALAGWLTHHRSTQPEVQT
jgi:hypothetical protein